MKVISVINLKGGVGKTFTTIQMAYYLTQNGYNVLLIDNDNQGNLSKFYNRFHNTTECAVSKLLTNKKTDLEALIEHTQHSGQFIVSANMSLLTATLEVTKAQTADQHLRFKGALDKLDAASPLLQQLLKGMILF